MNSSIIKVKITKKNYHLINSNKRVITYYMIKMIMIRIRLQMNQNNPILKNNHCLNMVMKTKMKTWMLIMNLQKKKMIIITMNLGSKISLKQTVFSLIVSKKSQNNKFTQILSKRTCSKLLKNLEMFMHDFVAETFGS